MFGFAWALLRFGKFVEAFLLFRSERVANRFPGGLHFIAQLWRDRFHQFLRAFLAGDQNFVDLITLRRGDVELTFHAPKEFDAHVPRRDIGGLETRASVKFLWASFGDFVNEQAARYNARAEDYHRGKDGLPGVHQVESAG